MIVLDKMTFSQYSQIVYAVRWDGIYFRRGAFTWEYHIKEDQLYIGKFFNHHPRLDIPLFELHWYFICRNEKYYVSNIKSWNSGVNDGLLYEMLQNGMDLIDILSYNDL